MKKRQNYLLLAIFFLMSIVSFSAQNTEVLTKSEIAEIRKVSSQNPDKLKSYIAVYTALQDANLATYSQPYMSNFTDGEMNFKVPTEKAIENFIKVYEANLPKYKKLDDALYMAGQKAAAKQTLKRLDNYAYNFIVNMKAESAKMKEMYRYYKNKEYKTDKFAKGKLLNDQYFSIIGKSSDSFLMFYNGLASVLND